MICGEECAAALPLAAALEKRLGSPVLIAGPRLNARIAGIFEPAERFRHDGAVEGTKRFRIHGTALLASSASRRSNLRRMMSCRRRLIGKFQIKGMASIWNALGTTQKAISMPRLA